LCLFAANGPPQIADKTDKKLKEAERSPSYDANIVVSFFIQHRA